MCSLAAFNGHRRVPPPVNEPVRSYAPGSAERASLKSRLASMAAEKIDIPLVIGGKEVRTGATGAAVMPHRHQHVLGQYHKATPDLVRQAIEAAHAARAEWSGWSFDDRAAVMLKAAELLTTDWRDTINAATMLGQSKTVFQAEIDSACEVIDFWRFNCHYGQELLDQQPVSDHSTWNQLEYRALEGFVYAVTPFNFTSIAANLPTAPALMGNTVIWKPASSAMLLGPPPDAPPPGGGHAAGRHQPRGGRLVDDLEHTALTSRSRGRALHGQHRRLQRHVEDDRRLDAELPVVPANRRGNRREGLRSRASFGQSRRAGGRDRARRIRVPGAEMLGGQPRLPAALALARRTGPHGRHDRRYQGGRYPGLPELHGRRHRPSTASRRSAGTSTTPARTRRSSRAARATTARAISSVPRWSKLPTRETSLLCEEIFGPVVTAYVYDDVKWQETLGLVDSTSPYGLTGAVFAQDRRAIVEASAALRHAAGNFYINDKPTGAVVGQQPFGGARASGTNDKAGSKLNLLRWVSARTIKETFNPPRDYRYPFMDAE